MRNICAILALTVVVGCGGSDGKDGADGRDGAQGTAGPAGVNGKDGSDGTDGAPGADGKDGAQGMDGADGTPGADGADGGSILQGAGAPAAALGADGDLYLDTTSHDVYQKANGAWSVVTNLSGGPPGPKGDMGAKGDTGAKGADGTNGADGADGNSVRSGAGAPAAGLGSVGDLYIDSTSGDLYSKGAGGWTKTGNLKGPAGADGADGADGKDAKGTLYGVGWFAFALTAAFVDAPNLITNQAYTETSSAASFAFTGAGQHGRIAFDTAGAYLPGGVNLSAYESLALTATATGGAVTNIVVLLTDGTKKGCQWNLTTAAGPDYSLDLSNPTSCYNTSLDADFSLASVTQVQIGLVSSAAGARTLTVTSLEFVDNL